MRICIVYDCLFPYTVGGGERWYRSLAERLACDGYDVTYLTRRQWPRGTRLDLDPRIKVVALEPRTELYTDSGRRKISQALIFGVGVLWHLARHGRDYDVVHSASFPYFSLLAAAAARRRAGFRIVTDWFEVWSRHYWRDYLGGVRGWIGYSVQRLCARVPQRAFCMSNLHAERLREEGLRGEVTVLRGAYTGDLVAHEPQPAEPLVMFAGRLIPEKRAPLGVAGVAAARAAIPGLRGVFYGDGPEYGAVRTAVRERGLIDVVHTPGFVPSETVSATMDRALCVLLPSSREGYGMVVVEAAARGTPSVVVTGEDNAVTELIEDGVNGVVATEPTPEAIAAAIVRIYEAGPAMRERTARWFADNAHRLSVDSSLDTVLAAYQASR